MERKQTLFAVMVTALLSLMLLPDIAAAIGTEAGTPITNVATATYKDANNNNYTATSATVTTYVSQVGGISATPTLANQTGSANVESYYPITLTNTGNGNDTFNLAYTMTVTDNGALSTDSWTVLLCLDNGDGILDASEYDPITNTCTTDVSSVTLGSDDKAYIVAVVIPGADASDTDVGVLSGTATSTFDPTKIASGTYTTTISGAVLNVQKAISDSNPQPGDTVTYTLTYLNNGTAPAYDVVFRDTIPTGVTYVSESITLNTVPKTDAPGDDEAEEVVVGGITTLVITLDQNIAIPVAGTGTITFQVTVGDLAEFDNVSNSATVTFNTTDNDDNTSATNNSTTSTLTVAHLPGVLVQPETLTTSELVGNLNQHPFTVTNTGNGDDTYNFTSVGLYWTWTIYHDNDQSGTYTVGDTLVTDSAADADTTKDTGVLAAGDTAWFVATTTVTGIYTQTGQHTLTATSSTDPTVKDTSIKYTDIQAPHITMNKAVTPTGNQPPGTELTYTITVSNIGDAQASGFFVSDILSSYLDYTEGSIYVGGVLQTDLNDADFGRYDIGAHTVFVSIPTISPGAIIDIVFKATIK